MNHHDKNYTAPTGVRSRHLQSGPRVLPGLAQSSEPLTYQGVSDSDANGDTQDTQQGAAVVAEKTADNSTAQGNNIEVVVIDSNSEASLPNNNNNNNANSANPTSHIIITHIENHESGDHNLSQEPVNSQSENDHVNISPSLLKESVMPSAFSFPRSPDVASEGADEKIVIQNLVAGQEHLIDQNIVPSEIDQNISDHPNSMLIDVSGPNDKVPRLVEPVPGSPFEYMGPGPLYSPYNPHYDPRFNMLSDPLSGFYPDLTARRAGLHYKDLAVQQPYPISNDPPEENKIVAPPVQKSNIVVHKGNISK